jgi:hypothetical protein
VYLLSAQIASDQPHVSAAEIWGAFFERRRQPVLRAAEAKQSLCRAGVLEQKPLPPAAGQTKLIW